MLLRRKVFTALSLFGITFTLMLLALASYRPDLPGAERISLFDDSDAAASTRTPGRCCS